MECEIDTNYDGWNYPTSGDTGAKNCQNYPNKPCDYGVGDASPLVHMDYYPPGYFGCSEDFLAAKLPSPNYADLIEPTTTTSGTRPPKPST